MDVHGPGSVNGSERIRGRKAYGGPERGSGETRAVNDRVEISSQAVKRAEVDAFREKLHDVPDVRADRVSELRELVSSGRYETEERIDGTINRVLSEFENG